MKRFKILHLLALIAVNTPSQAFNGNQTSQCSEEKEVAVNFEGEELILDECSHVHLKNLNEEERNEFLQLLKNTGWTY